MGGAAPGGQGRLRPHRRVGQSAQEHEELQCQHSTGESCSCLTAPSRQHSADREG